MSRLVVVEGPNRGAVFTIRAKRSRLGRGAAAELTLPDDAISRVHAEILDEGGGYAVADLGSKHGTYLNGVRVEGRYPLSHGDELRLGTTVLLFLDEGGAAAEGPDDAASDGASDTVTLDGASLDERQPRRRDAAAERRRAPTGPSAPAAPSAPVRASARLRHARTERRYLVGESEAIRRISVLVTRCAPVDTTVLIVGESGTGKELVAEALHDLSPRRDGPYLAVNCATLEPALVESDLFGHERGAFTGAVERRLGKLELARSGTLVLDEVGELPREAQAKLLRAIERREFQRVGGQELLRTDARIVAATNRDLAALVRAGGFREELLFRLRVVENAIPPLRERREDIQPLVEHLLQELRTRIGSRARSFTPEALECLLRYRFPGNVRELRNIIERCLIFTEKEAIGLADLPPEVRPQAAAAAETAFPGSAPAPPPPDDKLLSLGELERAHIERALAANAWNKTKVAEILGIDRATLYAKLKRYGITR